MCVTLLELEFMSDYTQVVVAAAGGCPGGRRRRLLRYCCIRAGG